MKRFGPPPLPNQRYIRRPGAYGVILSGGRAMLAVNNCKGEEWVLPGGGIDPGETPLRALHREAMEETGHRIRVGCRIGAYKRFTYMLEYDMWAEKICHIYLCHAVRQVASPTEPDHIPVWMDPIDAAAMLSLDGDRVLFLAGLRRAGLV
ncbi:MAG: NUDIX hydrolase [Pseudomonadota bacterium]